MNKIKNIDFTDFYFNGHWLSEFGGMIGGTEPIKDYPLLPEREYITDRAINQDGETLFNSYLKTRTFEVPIFFENIDQVGIRKIAQWLNSPSPDWFYYRNDSLKIKCVLDSGGSNLESLAVYGGTANLKFIAFDPYYYQLTNTVIEKNNIATTKTSLSYVNEGSECFCVLKLWGSGTIKVTVYKDSDVFKSCTVTDVVSGIIIDSLNHTCDAISGANKLDFFDGEFPTIPNGNYKIMIEGNISTLYFLPIYRFI